MISYNTVGDENESVVFHSVAYEDEKGGYSVKHAGLCYRTHDTM